MEPPVLPAQQENIEREAVDMLEGITALMTGYNEVRNKEFNRPFCASLCEAGYLVFSMEYRLIPDCLFYDQLADLHLALDFIRDQDVYKRQILILSLIIRYSSGLTVRRSIIDNLPVFIQPSLPAGLH